MASMLCAGAAPGPPRRDGSLFAVYPSVVSETVEHIQGREHIMRGKIRDYIETVIYAVITITTFVFIAVVLCIAGCVIGMFV